MNGDLSMALSKKKRAEVWNKSNGVCWYCGTKLPEKGWHADHFEAVYRLQEGGMWREHNDHIDNMVPACAPCNLFKSVFTVEQFRQELELQAERGRKSSVNFRTAERFGLIQVVDKPVVFWFEGNDK